jgi:hypothetical protein
VWQRALRLNLDIGPRMLPFPCPFGICPYRIHLIRASDRRPHLVEGRAFNRFVTIWLENTDFDDALADRKYLFHALPYLG